MKRIEKKSKANNTLHCPQNSRMCVINQPMREQKKNCIETTHAL